MKILFTSVGRRVELIQAFKEAANRNGIKLQLVGTDITPTAPALFFCDETVLTPRIKDPEYIPFLLKYCKENSIDALIPTIDTDLLILAENKDRFESTKVIISSPDMIKLCRDKRKTGRFFMDVGLMCPLPVDDFTEYKQGFPAFIKPKDGSSSINAYKVMNQEELESFANMVPDYIIQPFIEGTEYTVDAFCDFDGNPIYITPRIRLAVRSGEVLKTEICQDDTIISEMESLIKTFKPCGPITVQLIRESVTGKDFYIEINPRFGGGAPLSMKAGANSSEVLLKLLQGETCSYMEKAAENGAVFCRFDQSIRVDDNGK